MQDEEQQFERLLSVLERLSEAIETVSELIAIQIEESQSGDEEESSLSEPKPL